MKKIEIALYKFEELGEDARRRAMDDARQWVGDTQAEIDDDAYLFTKEEMERVLGISIKETGRGLSWQFTEMRWDDPDIRENPKYLMRYINWVQDRVDNRKSYWLPFDRSRHYHPTMTKRVSRITKCDFDCSLTGTWTDNAFDRKMKNALNYVRAGMDIDEFVDAIVREFAKDWEEDREWGYSDENVRDILEQNSDTDWYFEDGRKFDA